MGTLAKTIVEHVDGLPEGATVSAKVLLHLGQRAAVDQALSRLARRGALMRAGRGLYVRPVHSRFGSRAPAPSRVVEAIAAATGESIVSSGAVAANALGLTTQVPVRTVFLTSGRAREIKLGTQAIELRHAPKWLLTLANQPAGEAIRALAWLGPAQAEAALGALKGRLSAAELGALAGARTRLPTWMAEQVSRLVSRG